MIKIWEPRYRDRKVLIAAYKYKGQDLEIEITRGAYKGIYIVPATVINDSPRESMATKNETSIGMIAVSIDKLIRKDD